MSDTTEVLQFEGRFHVNCSIKSEKQENKGIIDAFVEWDIPMPTACSVLCDFPPTCPSPAPYLCRIRLT